MSWSVTSFLAYYFSLQYWILLYNEWYSWIIFKKKYFFSDCAHWITWKTTDPVWKKIIFTEASTPPALNIVIITISLLRIDVLCSCKHFTRADFLSSMFLSNVKWNIVYLNTVSVLSAQWLVKNHFHHHSGIHHISPMVYVFLRVPLRWTPLCISFFGWFGLCGQILPCMVNHRPEHRCTWVPCP